MEKIIGARHTGKTRIVLEDYVDYLRSGGEDTIIILSDHLHASDIYNEIKELLGDDFDRCKDRIDIERYVPPKLPPFHR